MVEINTMSATFCAGVILGYTGACLLTLTEYIADYIKEKKWKKKEYTSSE